MAAVFQSPRKRGVLAVVLGCVVLLAATSLLGWMSDVTRHPHSNALSAPVVTAGILALIAGAFGIVWGFFEIGEL